MVKKGETIKQPPKSPWCVITADGPYVRYCSDCGKAMRVESVRLSFGTVLTVTWIDCPCPKAIKEGGQNGN